jgi:hypothetical protein
MQALGRVQVQMLARRVIVVEIRSTVLAFEEKPY